MHEQMRSPSMGAHTYHQHARMLLTRARAEDRARAEKLLAHAAATATALGMTRLSHEVEELAKRSFGYAWSGAEVHAAK